MTGIIHLIIRGFYLLIWAGRLLLNKLLRWIIGLGLGMKHDLGLCRNELLWNNTIQLVIGRLVECLLHHEMVLLSFIHVLVEFIVARSHARVALVDIVVVRHHLLLMLYFHWGTIHIRQLLLLLVHIVMIARVKHLLLVLLLWVASLGRVRVIMEIIIHIHALQWLLGISPILRFLLLFTTFILFHLYIKLKNMYIFVVSVARVTLQISAN